MSVDIQFTDGNESFFSNAGWAFLLEFARAYGWQPVGTVEPEDWPSDKEWAKHYDPAEGQAITQNDSRLLADAIERGLADTNRQITADKITESMTAELQAATSSSVHQIQRFNFAEKTLNSWREFIDVARSCGFIIT